MFLLNKTPFSLLYAPFDGSTVIDVRLSQEENALPPMLVTLEGMVTLVMPLQESNALFPMLVTLEGIA